MKQRYEISQKLVEKAVLEILNNPLVTENLPVISLVLDESAGTFFARWWVSTPNPYKKNEEVTIVCYIPVIGENGNYYSRFEYDKKKIDGVKLYERLDLAYPEVFQQKISN